MGSWVTYGLGSENQDLPGFVALLSSGVQPNGGKNSFGNGFLPSVFQGVQCRSKGDPVLYVTDPKGMSRDLRRAGLDALNDLNRIQAKELGNAETITRMAQYEMDSRAFRLTTERARDTAKAGRPPGPESAMFKIYGTELNQRRLELLLSIAGPQALGWEGPGFEEHELTLTRDWLRSRGNSIEGGTSEIQLNIIAKRVLGLPD